VPPGHPHMDGNVKKHQWFYCIVGVRDVSGTSIKGTRTFVGGDVGFSEVSSVVSSSVSLSFAILKRGGVPPVHPLHPLQTQSVGLSGITQQRVGFPLKILD